MKKSILSVVLLSVMGATSAQAAAVVNTTMKLLTTLPDPLSLPVVQVVSVDQICIKNCSSQASLMTVIMADIYDCVAHSSSADFNIGFQYTLASHGTSPANYDLYFMPVNATLCAYKPGNTVSRVVFQSTSLSGVNTMGRIHVMNGVPSNLLSMSAYDKSSCAPGSTGLGIYRGAGIYKSVLGPSKGRASCDNTVLDGAVCNSVGAASEECEKIDPVTAGTLVFSCAIPTGVDPGSCSSGAGRGR